MSPPGLHATAAPSIAGEFSDSVLAGMPKGTTFDHRPLVVANGFAVSLRTWVGGTEIGLWTTDYLLFHQFDREARRSARQMSERLRRLRATHFLALFVQFPLWWENESVLGVVVAP